MRPVSGKTRWQFTAVGVLLCLLAALFAIEAKLAWYGPAGSAAAQISYSKAQPADAPKFSLRSVTPSFPAPSVLEIATLLTLILLTEACRLLLRPLEARSAALPSSGLSPQLFFRPPPVL